MALRHQGTIVSGAGAVDCGCDGAMVSMLSISYGGSVPDSARQSASMTISSSGSFQILPSVEAGSFLYLKPSSDMLVQLTQTGIVQGDPNKVTELTIAAGNATILHFPTAQPLKELALKGAGTLEYLVAGLK